MKSIVIWLAGLVGDIADAIFPVRVEYKREGPSLEQMTDREMAERREESLQLDGEASEFLAQVGNSGPSRWTFGESAHYESIRRREATI